VKLALAVWLAAGLAEPASDPQAPLKAAGLLTDADLQQLGAGEVVAKVLDTPDRAEVASFAAVRVRASAARFLACVRDVTCLRANEDLLQEGRFEASPSAHDLAGLSLDERDRDSLAHCEVGRCDVRLPADAIEAFRTKVDWSAGRGAAAAAELFRTTLAGLAVAYREQGNHGLVVYRDNARPASIAASTDELLQRQWAVLAGAPELLAYLRDFPQAQLDGGEDFLYWYKEKFWRKTVVNLNHVIVYPKREAGESRIYVATKQLYSTHYYESGIEVLLFASDPGAASGTLLFLSRARADIRPSGFNWLERVIIRRLVRGRLMNQFRVLRQRLESAAQP